MSADRSQEHQKSTNRPQEKGISLPDIHKDIQGCISSFEEHLKDGAWEQAEGKFKELIRTCQIETTSLLSLEKLFNLFQKVGISGAPERLESLLKVTLEEGSKRGIFKSQVADQKFIFQCLESAVDPILLDGGRQSSSIQRFVKLIEFVHCNRASVPKPLTLALANFQISERLWPHLYPNVHYERKFAQPFLLQLAVVVGAPAKTISMLCELGADVNHKFQIPEVILQLRGAFQRSGDPARDNKFGIVANHLVGTPFHIAARLLKTDLIEPLIQAKADPWESDHNGQSALLAACKAGVFRDKKESDIFKLLRSYLDLPETLSAANFSLIAEAVSSRAPRTLGYANGDVMLKAILTEAQNKKFIPDRIVIPFKSSSMPGITTRDLLKFATDLRSNLPNIGVESWWEKSALSCSKRLYYLYLTVNANDHIERATEPSPRLNALTGLVPVLLNYLPVQGSVHFAAGFDNHAYKKPEHHNTADILALLNHPELEDDKDWGTFSKAITAPYNWNRVHGKDHISGEQLETWRTIGWMTYSFAPLLHDTRSFIDEDGSKHPSVIEEWGAGRVLGRRTDKNNKYPGDFMGTGYAIKPHSPRIFKLIKEIEQNQGTKSYVRPETYIEIRRSYYLLKTPGEFGILIRNSSPDFGRDLLKHPFYIIPKNSTLYLPHIDPKLIRSEFIPGTSVDDSIQGRAHHAVIALEQVFREFERFRFDTDPKTAWNYENPKRPKLVGAWLSPGFKIILGRIKSLYQEATKENHFDNPKSAYSLPYMVITKKEFPMFSLLTQPMTISFERIKTLEDLVNGRATDEQLETTDLRKFFDIALRSNGRFTLLPREGERYAP